MNASDAKILKRFLKIVYGSVWKVRWRQQKAEWANMTAAKRAEVRRDVLAYLAEHWKKKMAHKEPQLQEKSIDV